MPRKPMSEETKAKIAAKLQGKKKSAAMRAKMTEVLKERWQDPDYQKKQRKAQTASHSSPEMRALASDFAHRRWDDGSK